MRRAIRSVLPFGSSLTSSAIYISHFMRGSLRIAAAIVLRCGSNGRKENLHSLWDTALVELEQGSSAEIAARIQAAVTTEDKQQWQKGTPPDWALESLAIVRAQVYRLPASGEIDATYTEPARAVIRTRLAQAGVRLAWMLNETLPARENR